jgi:hypothetical protein
MSALQGLKEGEEMSEKQKQHFERMREIIAKAQGGGQAAQADQEPEEEGNQ